MNDCPYCLSPILDTEEVARCPICGTAYHAECLLECGGCAYKDCEKRARPKPIEINVNAEPHTVLVLSREAVEQAPRASARRTSNPCLKCGAQLPEGELYCLECEPMITESMDVRNLGPLLVMVGLIALVVGWMAMWLLTPQRNTAANDLTVGPITREVEH